MRVYSVKVGLLLLARWTGITLLAALFVFFIWPTPYIYLRKAPDVYRVNRFTGVRQVSSSHGWTTQGSTAVDPGSVWDAQRL